MSVGLAFIARRFTADARLIALISTTGLLFRGTIGPFINYTCDRIWTPFGRRRPFIVTAYLLSAIGLFVIPLTHSLAALIAVVACHGFALSFASPMEPLYMETVPSAQQGRSQAIRMGLIDASVLFFFQVSLAQYDIEYPTLEWWPETHVTGMHLAFWLGAALFFVVSFYLACCVKEKPPASGPEAPAKNPRILELLKSFPRDVFADWRWWPIYGLYIAPGLVSGIWGSFQSLMLVEQFGYDMTSMARLGLPVSLIGMAVVGPLLGYCADRGFRFQPWQWLLGALLLLALASLAYRAMPVQSRELPPLPLSLGFCLAIGLAFVGIMMAGVTGRRNDRDTTGRRSRFIIVSLSGQLIVAGLAWVFCQLHRDSSFILPASTWLSYLAISQALGMGTTVALMPLLFSKIPQAKFGTVSSGFGLFGSATTYILGNMGGVWVHAWSRSQGSSSNLYTSLWLLQAVLGALALALVVRCLRATLRTTN